MRVEPIQTLSGIVPIPGDKSISHRYAILAGMASGSSIIDNYSTSRDCHSTLVCLQHMGVNVQQTGDRVEISSAGWKSLSSSSPTLDAGNSGTTIRLLTALLAACPHQVSISGDDSLNQRPMKRIIDPLTRMGAEIEARKGQFPPLKIRGQKLNGISYVLPVASAQVKSCVLIAGLTTGSETVVIEPTPSRDHTERALPHFGAIFEKSGQQLRVKGAVPLEPVAMRVPGDLSSAVYFVVAALLVRDSELEIPGVGINPTRYGLMDLLEKSGAELGKRNFAEVNSEPSCDLLVSRSEPFLEGFPSEIRGELIPNVIDEIPILAVLGTRLRNGLIIRDASELRKKESDRIHSIVTNLRALGVEVEEYEDGFSIPPLQSIRGGKVKTFNDHRIAMAFSIAGLISEQGVEIDYPACADISFPGFFDRLASIVDR
jgi:3-phosphoshikimate 1-carboxyvinyltransferase